MSMRLPQPGHSRLRTGALLLWGLLAIGTARTGAAQLGQLISPGPLSKAHAGLEGIANCDKCHEQGKKVSAPRCLSCHKAVAERIAQQKGMHRDVKGDCTGCHIEHAGRDADIRHFDTRAFDHRAETGFVLDGRHAAITTQCASCHKTRSFLGLSPACASCHADPHKGRLGSDCARCHSVAVPFENTRNLFDHSKTAFPLEGAHRTVECAKCHVNQLYKGIRFQSCTDCHRNPHRESFGADCRSCHNVASWNVARFDHARTGAPLVGKHALLACAQCHVKPAMQAKIRMTPCAGCHKDPHHGEFKQDCAACHRETGFKSAGFDHLERTGFALAGKHAALVCSGCHKRAASRASVEFRGLRRECASCHADAHKGQLGTACEKCHTPATFRVTSFTHPRFPEFYGGRHANLGCDQCHKGAVNVKGLAAVRTRVYRNLSTDCVTCHRDVHLGQFPQCTSCHSIEAAKFAPVRFQHDRTAFALTGRHQGLECKACHKIESGTFPGGKGSAVRFHGLAAQCASCHKDVHLGQLGAKCDSCHTTATFALTSYRHKALTAFFRGKHAVINCHDCHKRAEGVFPAGRGIAVRFTGIGTNCAACHQDPHQGQLGASCGSCHAVDAAWKNANRAFHKAGLFPLEGRHLSVACASCHWNGVIKGTPNTCYDCHWVRRQDDIYKTRLGNQCETCHRPFSWAAVTFDHAARTGFALNAAHRGLSCERCHSGQLFTQATSACSSCHMKDYQATANPSHQAAGFPLSCQTCHRASDSTWHQAHFDHSTFPLAGAHSAQVCAACHGNGVFKGTPRECAACHKADYDRSVNPNHAAAGFSTACETCHEFADATWNQARYAHTAWPLLGAHSSVACSTCHKNSVFHGLASDCVSCHRSNYDSATNPPHAAAGFPLSCEPCHKVADASWQQGQFDHSSFPLAGMHTTQACAACHKNNIFKGTPRTCSGCHQTDFNNTKNPNHAAAGFSNSCESCHKFSDASWQQGVFTHSTFPLAGAHAVAVCAACHANGVYAGTVRTCSGCHQTDYNNTKNPNHVSAGFPTTCDSCHKFSDTTWQQGVFTHATFPLAGAHAVAVCAACHVNGIYAGTTRVCSGCHQTDYNNTKNPNHVAAGFPTTCDSCHKFSDTSWQQGVFTHSTFPLAGAHATAVCAACHKNGVYAGTTRTCVGCHQTDYNNTRNPNHIAAGFPTTCDTCHKFSDTSWQQGVFDHGWFPITSGPHAGNPCSACHTSPTNFAVFTCLTCHDRASTDSHHRGVGGYRYDSSSCYACHPQGRGD